MYHDRGPSRVSPLLVPMMMANATAGLIGIEWGLTGPNFCVATACAPGANSIGEATRLIREGACDVVVAGGTECAADPGGPGRLLAHGRAVVEPRRRQRQPPLRRRPRRVRDGGGGRLPRARGRRVGLGPAGRRSGARCSATAAPATPTTSPPRPTPAPARWRAWRRPSPTPACRPSDIGHVNAHGTSTPLNDAAESAAITKVFGPGGVPVTSTKGVTGHLIGAAGAVEAIVALLAIREGEVPPTANHEQAGDDIEADMVAGRPRPVGAEAGGVELLRLRRPQRIAVFGPARVSGACHGGSSAARLGPPAGAPAPRARAPGTKLSI